MLRVELSTQWKNPKNVSFKKSSGSPGWNQYCSGFGPTMDYSQRGQFFDSFLGNIFSLAPLDLVISMYLLQQTHYLYVTYAQLKYVTLPCTWYQTLNSTLLNIEYWYLFPEYGTYQGYLENIETCCKYFFDLSKPNVYVLWPPTMYLNEDVTEVMYTFLGGCKVL